MKIKIENKTEILLDNLDEALLQRLRHSAIPTAGELGNNDLIALTLSSDSIYVDCNAISGNSNPRVLIVTTQSVQF